MKRDMVFKAAIFDMDGVIVDSHPIHQRAWRRLLESTGRTVTESDLEFVLDGRRKEDILRHFFGDLVDQELIHYSNHKERLFHEEAERLLPLPGLPTFLQCLRDASISLGVGSSGSRQRVQFTLEKLELRSFFSTVVTGDDVEHGKPDPAVFKLAASRLRCEPSEVVIFEDAVSGIEAARAAGMRCVGIAQNGRSAALANAGASLVLPDFLGIELDQFVQQMNGN
jgi:beta-phosphoglucomutase